MSQPGGTSPYRRGRRVSTVAGALTRRAAGVAVVGLLATAVPAFAAAPGDAPTTTSAPAAAAPAAAAPGAGPATATPGAPGSTVVVPNTTVTVPGMATPVPVPGIPPVAPQFTDGQDPAALLQRALALTSVGASQGPLEASLAAAQQTLTAQSVIAQHAAAAAAAAATAAAVADQRAAEAGREAGDLEVALRTAALNIYTGGTETVGLAPTVDDLDELGDAAAYEDALLSPQGILASQRAVVRSARADQAARHRDEATAAEEAATDQAAAASAAAATDQIRAELGGLTAADATLVADEHTDVSNQAAHNLTSPDALEFTPAAPLPAPLPTTSVALAWIFSELGKPYLWGGTGPDMFDCSGLTQYVWNKAGVQIPRVAQDQEGWTVPVPLSQLEPGDLVFYGTSSDIHHVGMYIGDGLMVNAPHTGTVVQVSDIWWTDLYGFGRVHAAGVAVPARPATASSTATVPAVVETAGAVPSESAPPPGYVAPPGATAPVDTTTVPPGRNAPTTTAPGPTTTVAPSPPPSSGLPGIQIPADTTTTTTPARAGGATATAPASA